MRFAIIHGTGNWVPSSTLLYIVLIMGAFLTAGVAMSAFSFYEDYYWGDKNFRDQLRFHPSNRNSSKQNTRKV